MAQWCLCWMCWSLETLKPFVDYRHACWMNIENRTKYEIVNLWFVSKYVRGYPYFLDSFCLVNRKTRCQVNLNGIYIKKITTLIPNNTWKHILFFKKKTVNLITTLLGKAIWSLLICFDIFQNFFRPFLEGLTTFVEHTRLRTVCS